MYIALFVKPKRFQSVKSVSSWQILTVSVHDWPLCSPLFWDLVLTGPLGWIVPLFNLRVCGFFIVRHTPAKPIVPLHYIPPSPRWRPSTFIHSHSTPFPVSIRLPWKLPVCVRPPISCFLCGSCQGHTFRCLSSALLFSNGWFDFLCADGAIHQCWSVERNRRPCFPNHPFPSYFVYTTPSVLILLWKLSNNLNK